MSVSDAALPDPDSEAAALAFAEVDSRSEQATGRTEKRKRRERYSRLLKLLEGLIEVGERDLARIEETRERVRRAGLNVTGLTREQIRGAGYLAATAGIEREANPYPADDEFRDVWLSGWTAGSTGSSDHLQELKIAQQALRIEPDDDPESDFMCSTWHALAEELSIALSDPQFARDFPKLRNIPAAFRAKLLDSKELGPDEQDEVIREVLGIVSPFFDDASEEDQDADRASADPLPPAEATELPKGRFAFKLSGNVYVICFDDEEATVKKSLGCLYVHRLLQQPSKPISCIDLRGDVLETDTGRTDREDSKEALRELYKRLQRLDGEIERAQSTEELLVVAECEAEKAKLREEVNRLTGLGGKPRAATWGRRETARSGVQQAIRKLLKFLEKPAPRLHAHLRESIRTGADCVYNPRPPVPPWEL